MLKQGLFVLNNAAKQTGATLIELILSIVIISTALAGILGLVNLTVLHSADPLVQHQAIAIAESYLEEITALPVVDPNGTNTGETRVNFDNIDDYDGLNDVGARDQDNNVITNLGNYTVDVNIADQVISGVTMKAITVSVSRASVATINITGYRATY
jgi:MSHA pilin protein MshD